MFMMTELVLLSPLVEKFYDAMFCPNAHWQCKTGSDFLSLSLQL